MSKRSSHILCTVFLTSHIHLFTFQSHDSHAPTLYPNFFARLARRPGSLRACLSSGVESTAALRVCANSPSEEESRARIPPTAPPIAPIKPPDAGFGVGDAEVAAAFVVVAAGGGGAVVVAAGGGGAVVVGFVPPTWTGIPIGLRLIIGPLADPWPPIAAPTPRGFASMIGAGADAACVVGCAVRVVVGCGGGACVVG